MSLYLDYNASSPLDERVLECMIKVYRNYIGNADSRTHDYGNGAREIVENARKQVAGLLAVNPNEVFFTSGATESNNIAIQGLAEYAAQTGKKHIITTSIEHKAVLETVKEMGRRGFATDIIDPENDGRVTSSAVLCRLRKDTLLVSIMHVNNETGIIQPVQEIGKILAERGIFFHVDATQSCGKLVDEIRNLNYDMLSFSAHKLRGPQGAGCLILKRKDLKLPPVKAVMFGGQQENGIRPGTVPVALVAGCGMACKLAGWEYAADEKKLKQIKNLLFSLLQKSGLKYSFHGNQEFCMPNTVNVCLHGISSEALMILTKQYCSISNGSACTSRNYSPSYVLTAMGIPAEQIENSFRISWGPDTDPEQFTQEFSKLLETARNLIS